MNNLTDFALISGESLEYVEPLSYEEAMNNFKLERWKDAMKEEVKSLLENKT